MEGAPDRRQRGRRHRRPDRRRRAGPPARRPVRPRRLRRGGRAAPPRPGRRGPDGRPTRGGGRPSSSWATATSSSTPSSSWDWPEVASCSRSASTGAAGRASSRRPSSCRSAAFLDGRHAQAFPSFGSERTGAPVVAFCRIDDRADPHPRARRRARRAAHPGPHAPAPGRRVRRAAPRRPRARQLLPRRSTSSGWASWPRGIASPSRPGDRAGPRAPRAPAAGSAAPRGLRRRDRRDLARAPSPRPSASASTARSPRATSRPPGPRHDLEGAHAPAA